MTSSPTPPGSPTAHDAAYAVGTVIGVQPLVGVEYLEKVE